MVTIGLRKHASSLEERLQQEPTLGLPKSAGYEDVGRMTHGIGRAAAAVKEGLPELLPGITAGLGAMGAAYYGKNPSAGAALGGSVGAIPFILRESKK